MANKLKAVVPQPPTGNVFTFQALQTAVGVAVAYGLERIGLEDIVRSFFKVSTE
jgi:hypothetical protein